MLKRRRSRLMIVGGVGLSLLLGLTVVTIGESEEEAAIEPAVEEQTVAEDVNTPEKDVDTPDDVMEQLLKQREDSPVVQPETGPNIEYVENQLGVLATKADLDPAIIGVAPGQAQPKLRREGDFIVSRRGRLIRSPDGAHVLFVFAADGKYASEPPMIMQKCRRLEDMENYVQKRGDNVIFIVSGQIHTYRSANYLLPTMMKIATDQGNLQ